MSNQKDDLISCVVHFGNLHCSDVDDLMWCRLFCRGPVLNVDSSPSHGSILLSKDKKTLVWSIGEDYTNLRLT